MIEAAPPLGVLTIIVTFYDETAFIRTALRSIFNQGLPHLDVIVVNDNPESFDAAALERLTKGFDVRIIHHLENRGLSAARNTGIDAALGDHIGFLDADDYYTVGGLAAQWSYAQETQADITHAACYLGRAGGASGTPLLRDATLHMRKRVISGRLAAEEAQFIVSSWSSLYRTEFLTQNALWFDVEQRKFEDRLFVLHTVTKARKVAFLGAPVRVWRQRANSISSASTTFETHVLQVQLLEKCLAHMRAETKANKWPKRYEKRELFNCVSRLIWDMDILGPLAAGAPEYADLGQRITALLGDDSFGHPIFNDPMVAATSRVGMRTRKGRITRADFFALHKHWREGDFQAAQALMQARKAALSAPSPVKPVAHRFKRLVLHIGLHKTGSTYIQHHLHAHRAALANRGVLVPHTGFDGDKALGGRPGAMSGHQGLLRALRQDDAALWRAFHDEVSKSAARTVVISAENMGFPTDPDRAELVQTLLTRLGSFAQVDVVALMRRPDSYVERFYREWVTSAHPAGCRSIAETLVDHADALTDYAGLIAPFEAATGGMVKLADFDALRAQDALWQGFCRLSGLPEDLPQQDVPRYASARREDVLLMQLMNMCGPAQAARERMMGAYFAGPSQANAPDQSLLSPEARQDLIDRFASGDLDMLRARGYAPDVTAWTAGLAQEDWHPPRQIDVEQVRALLDVGAQIAGEVDARGSAPASHPTSRAVTSDPYTLKIKMRPWAVRLIERLRRR